MEETSMSDAIITSDKLSPNMVKAAFDAAYMKTTTDKDGDITVNEGGRRFYVFVNPDKETIRFVSYATGNRHASSQQRLAYANKINTDLVALRAREDNDGDIIYDYTIITDGGITMRQVVMAAKRFAVLLRMATDKDDEHALA